MDGGALRGRLQDRLPARCVVWEEAVRRRFRCDALYADRSGPLVVIRPGGVDELREAVVALAEQQVAMVPVGAGLSYSAATLPDQPWAAMDMSSMARVRRCDARQRHVRVEAGCTWAALREALAPQGLRTPFWGPASGLHATIGGAVGSNAVFFGSGLHGSMADCVLGLTVMLADGTLLHTGIHAAEGPLASPLGPDFTRSFVGACGAFGIVVDASLRLITSPPLRRFEGFECASLDAAVEALSLLGAQGKISEALVLSPPQDTAAPRDGDRARHSLSLCLEADAPEALEAARHQVLACCREAGARHTGRGELEAFHDRPFQVPDMLRSVTGVRWIPVHAIVGFEQVGALVAAVQSLLQSERPRLGRLDLSWHYSCILVGGTRVLVEFSLCWPDSGNALLAHYLGAAHDGDGMSPAAQTIVALRERIVRTMAGFRATHLQIGRLYDCVQRLDPAAQRLLRAVKEELDPDNLFNPGVLTTPQSRRNR